MQRCGDRQPRQEDPVLHRVPRPEATPSQLAVGPVCAGKHPRSQQQPTRYEPALDRGSKAVRVAIAGEQPRGDERSGHSKGHEPAVHDRRVIEHRRMAQDGHEPEAIE